ncbi:hypothetical protein [Candidatus Nitronereus thalassa]|uniref:DUF4340 domain-containing protein n=1 Tax=Candidatus Nitronereus thalassa TaxID=3020898 RepID=A0ABU3K8B6_9BACT|nr:hypothetical protein [Candidatus Nitronereus thalassa]MDT7042689.1 hypothetical protein [Candidatus Nitronereus thalassa]
MTTPKEKRSSQNAWPSWITSGSTLIGGLLLLALFLMYWPTPSHISLETTVSRAEMTLGTFPSQQILNPLEVESISFGQFSKIEFHPSVLQVADPNQYDMQTDSFAPEAWQPLTMFGYIRFSNQTPSTLVTIHPEDRGQKILGTLEPIHVREESNVIFEMDEHDPSTITMKISGPETRVILTPTQPFEIIADETKIDGIKDMPFREEPSLTFRPDLPERRPQIEIRGSEQLLTLTVKITRSPKNHMLSDQPMTVSSLDFSRQGPTGNRVTALVQPGTLHYPDFKDLPVHTIPATDFVSIEPKKVMTIKHMMLQENQPGLKLLLDGTAKHIQSGSSEFPIDHRLSKFDELWNNTKVQLLYGLWKDIK